MSEPEFIYKVATAAALDESRQRGAFSGMPVDERDGYIHMSTAAQLPETLRLHFAGQSGLMLFAVRTAELGATLRWEPSRGGQLFPHIYGLLPIYAVAWTAAISVAPDGGCELPAAVR